jgi:hypothetical protein
MCKAAFLDPPGETISTFIIAPRSTISLVSLRCNEASLLCTTKDCNGMSRHALRNQHGFNIRPSCIVGSAISVVSLSMLDFAALSNGHGGCPSNGDRVYINRSD